MKYYLIAGEASGDLHGSNLMKELKKLDDRADFRFFGGELMQQAGGKLVKHYREMAFMGIWNVVKNIATIKKNLEHCKTDLLKFKPDVLILIDYPGFNLRMAEFAKKNGIKVFYYIAPKVWAWKEYRVKQIRNNVDELFTILPFETEYFRKHGIEVKYVGNPILDAISAFKQQSGDTESFRKSNNLDQRPIVALLAGSRKQEVNYMLPVMVQAALSFSDFQFVVAGVDVLDKKLYESYLAGSSVKIVFNQTYKLLENAYAALVSSGTATLETALFKVPQVVLYKVEGGWLVHAVMKKFVLKIKWVSLPNLILNKGTLKEILQVELTVKNVMEDLKRLCFDLDYRENIIKDYNELEKKIGSPGSSAIAALKMIECLNA